MKKFLHVILIVGLSTFVLGCGKTWSGVKTDSKQNWQKTKEGTKEAWDSTKEAVHEATAD